MSQRPDCKLEECSLARKSNVIMMIIHLLSMPVAFVESEHEWWTVFVCVMQ